MREIKFRAWHSEHKAYCEGKTSNMFQWIEECQPIELEQFTGLKDKNGVDIYEGDKVSFYVNSVKYESIVSYNNSSFRLRVDYDNGYNIIKKYYHIPASNKIEIIGNIHD